MPGKGRVCVHYTAFCLVSITLRVCVCVREIPCFSQCLRYCPPRRLPAMAAVRFCTREEVAEALAAAEGRAAHHRASLAEAEEEIAVLRVELRERKFLDYGVSKPAWPGDGGSCGPGSSRSNSAGRAHADDHKVAPVKEDPSKDHQTKRIRRNVLAQWPEDWVQMDWDVAPRGGGCPENACVGCWWLFQDWKGYRKHRRDALCLLAAAGAKPEKGAAVSSLTP